MAGGLGGLLAGRWLWVQDRLAIRTSSEGEAYHMASRIASSIGIDRIAPLSPISAGEQPRIPLPRHFEPTGVSLDQAIQARRSVRDYSPGPLSLLRLGQLLYMAYGITSEAQGLRAAPSAGARYPVDVYPVVHRVDSLEPGVYKYVPAGHLLELCRPGDWREPLQGACLGQRHVATAAVACVLAVTFQRTRDRYGDRAYRYVLLDAGHVGENLYLAATALGLGPCGVGAFSDDDVNAILGIDGNSEAAVYLVSVGTL